jgi:hypothetical protein
MSPLAIALIVVATIMAGASVGAFLRTRLPRHHLDDETKQMVQVGIKFLSTLAALVLGLIIASAKSSFDTKSEEMQSATAKILLLDDNLRQLGSSADPARNMLRQIVSSRIGELWGNDGAAAGMPAPGKAAPRIGELENALRTLSPSGEGQRLAWTRSLQLAGDLAQIRSLASAQVGSSITMPLLVLLVFWLAIIALGWNIYAPRHGTIHALNVLCAVSSAGAIFLILEMDRPFGGMIRISDAPLRAVQLHLSQ